MSVCDLTMSCVCAGSRRKKFSLAISSSSISRPRIRSISRSKSEGRWSEVSGPNFRNLCIRSAGWLVYAALCRLSSDRHSRWATDPSPSSPSPRPTVLPSLPVCNGRTLSAVSKCYANEICLRNIKNIYLDCPAITLAVQGRSKRSGWSGHGRTNNRAGNFFFS